MTPEPARSLDRPAGAASAATTVAVVVTTYNHARFLGDAIESVIAQTRRPDEIIVVDDGSTDDPQSVVAGYEGVRFIRQSNQGLAAARNTGLFAARSDAIVFLDADDRLLPTAVAAGLRRLAEARASGLVYGGHRRISVDGQRLGEDRYDPIGGNPYATLLCGNVIGMHATVMYRRACLVAVGGFDPSLPRCEDYDVYLRLARRYPVASHPEIVAEYRWHGANVSLRHREMLRWVLAVHDRQRVPASSAPETTRAWARGREVWRDYYCGESLAAAKAAWRDSRAAGRALELTAAAAAIAPSRVAREGLRLARRRLRQAGSQRRTPKPGSARLGDLDRVEPIDDDFGYGRGTPVDRYYIEAFLERHAGDIAGRVLEIGDDGYTRRFGGRRAVQADVLHVHEGHPAATIVGDLAAPGVLPADAFDCLVITQTLHLIYDMRAAVAQIHRALKPGGVALVTVPGITRIDRGEWKSSWHWSLTTMSARRLFAEAFGEQAVAVESRGNVFAATMFLQGIALEELEREKLDFRDDAYPVIVAVRARKPGRPQEVA